MNLGDGEEPGPVASAHETGGKHSTLQQRFEDSRLGQNVISVVVVVIVLVGVVYNLPDSPLRRELQPVVAPTQLVNLNRSWAMFAPNPPMRREGVEVHVTMADGSTRIWTRKPMTGLSRLLVANRWELLLKQAVIDATIRPRIARWVVREVTRPSERPVRVALIFRTENLPPPGIEGGSAVASKVLYQEELTSPR